MDYYLDYQEKREQGEIDNPPTYSDVVQNDSNKLPYYYSKPAEDSEYNEPPYIPEVPNDIPDPSPPSLPTPFEREIPDYSKQQPKHLFDQYEAEPDSNCRRYIRLFFPSNHQPKRDRGGAPSSCTKLGAIISGIINFAGMITCFYFWYSFVIAGSNRPFKGACFSFEDMNENICLFAANQFAFGIITVGQITVGAINLSQIGIGILFGFGQVQGGIGYALGQVALGTYIRGAQIGFGFYRVCAAQIGFQTLSPFYYKESYAVSCHNESDIDNDG